MSAVLPKFRSDLILSQQETVEGRNYILKDPDTGQFFRFREAEHFIIQQCDGETPLEVVRQRIQEKFDNPLAIETLTAFIRSLEKAGFFESEKNSKTQARSSGRVRGSLLFLRFKLFDPDRLFTRLMPKVRFFFTPHFIVSSAIVILLAIGITINHASEFGQHFERLLHLSTLPLLLVTVFLVITTHEFAHGLTCKYFGGEVHEIGFLLMYFQPAFYCNVSDAWLFPEKAKRLWVALAGAYFELFIWAVATLLWRLTDVETWLNQLAFIVMASSGVKTLLNFNPLIKLDGYYLLSDYLEIPNLRMRSFRYLGQWFRRLTGAAVQAFQPLTARERKIFLSYGLVSTVYSFALLLFVAVQAGGFLVEQNQPLSFTLFAGLLSVKFRQRLGRFFIKASPSAPAISDPDDEDSFSPAPNPDPQPSTILPKETAPVSPAAPTQHAPPPANHEPQSTNHEQQTTNNKHSRKRPRLFGKRKLRLSRRQKTWLPIGVVALAILFFGKTELRIAGDFNVLPIHNADVRAELEGLIEEISVKEGDNVQAGDIIAKLSGRDFKAELAKTEALIEQARAKLKMLAIGPTTEEIEVARTAVLKSEDALKYARRRLERDQQLFEQKLLSQKDYEDTQELTVTAVNSLSEAKSKLNVLLRGSRPEELDAIKAEINGYLAQRSYLEEQIRLLSVRTPASGMIVTPARQLQALKHQLIKKGDLIAKVHDVKTMTAEILIPEKEIADIQPGHKVLVKARAYPHLSFQGTVTAIATTALGPSSSSTTLMTGAGRSILVTTQIDNRSLLLKPEMTGRAKIYCGQRQLFNLLTRRFIRMVKVDFWSWW